VIDVPLRPAHQRDGLDQRHLRRAAAGLGPFLGLLGRADRADAVPGLDARALGRRALDRGHDLDVLAGRLRDLDAEAVELALGLDLHLVELGRLHEGGVGIEVLEQAPHRALEQGVLVDFLDVVAADELEDAREEGEVLVALGDGGARPVFAGGGLGLTDEARRRDRDRHAAAERSQEVRSSPRLQVFVRSSIGSAQTLAGERQPDARAGATAPLSRRAAREPGRSGSPPFAARSRGSGR
jgi:hypothetical protein